MWLPSVLTIVAGLILTPWTNAIPAHHLDYAPHARASKYGIPGADVIRAGSLQKLETNMYLTSPRFPGGIEPLMVGESDSPPTFILKNGRLFAYFNQTSVSQVRVVPPEKSQSKRPDLFQLQLGDPSDTDKKGEWFYVGSLLWYSADPLPPPLRVNEQGSQGQKIVPKNGKRQPVGRANDGVWLACETRSMADKRHGRVLYVDFHGYDTGKRPVPEDCEMFTLRSWGDMEM